MPTIDDANTLQLNPTYRRAADAVGNPALASTSVAQNQPGERGMCNSLSNTVYAITSLSFIHLVLYIDPFDLIVKLVKKSLIV